MLYLFVISVFFADSWLCFFPASPFFCFSCFPVFLLLCFPCFSVFLLLYFLFFSYFSAFLFLCFLLFLLLCFSACPFVCFSVCLDSLFSASHFFLHFCTLVFSLNRAFFCFTFSSSPAAALVSFFYCIISLFVFLLSLFPPV